jgi:hypothetical protein
VDRGRLSVPSLGLFWPRGEVCTVADLRAFLEGYDGPEWVRLVRPEDVGFWGVIVEPPGSANDPLTVG